MGRGRRTRRGLGRWWHSVDDGEDVFFAHDQEFLVVELDFGAAVAGEDDAVALLDGEGDAFAGVRGRTEVLEDLAGLVAGGMSDSSRICTTKTRRSRRRKGDLVLCGAG
jgi:hypothetical protein